MRIKERGREKKEGKMRGKGPNAGIEPVISCAV